VPVWEPAATTTDDGRFTALDGLADKDTAAPPDGAGADKVTVHDDVCGADSVTGLQVNALSPGEIVTVPAVFDVPRLLPVELAAELLASCTSEEVSDV
jgi:hypothetical protein